MSRFRLLLWLVICLLAGLVAACGPLPALTRPDLGTEMVWARVPKECT